jgi:hypothetical protein
MKGIMIMIEFDNEILGFHKLNNFILFLFLLIGSTQFTKQSTNNYKIMYIKWHRRSPSHRNPFRRGHSAEGTFHQKNISPNGHFTEGHFAEVISPKISNHIFQISN